MLQRIKFILRLFITLILIFVTQKIIFMLVNIGHADGAPFWSCVASLWHGLRLDVVSACYIIIVPTLVMFISFFFKSFPLRKVLAPYYVLAAFLMALIFLADVVIYFFWGAKLDAGELIYVDKPKEMFASLDWWVVIAMLSLLGLVTWHYFRRLRHATTKTLDQPRSRWASLIFIPMAGLIFLGMRGSVTQSTANPSFAYFSKYEFCNHSALNPFFNMFRSMFKTVDFEHEFEMMDAAEAESAIAPGYQFDASVVDTLLRTDRPDLLLVIWEGGCWDMVMNDSVGPNISRFASEGVAFTNCYANSFRTDRGVVSLLSGWMGMPTTSLMKMGDVCRKLPGLASRLADEGYNTRFVYGGDIDYTNMRGYLLETGFAAADGSSYFPNAMKESSWGALDENTMLPSVLLNPRTNPAQSPQFTALLTLSSHEPWIVPMQRLADPHRNAFAYTDSCLGVLVDSLRSMPVWDNLLIVIIPDHGVPCYNSQSLANPSMPHIPMVWIGGAVRGHRDIDVIMNQSDMASTLLAQMGLDAKDFVFSRNVLSESYAKGYHYALHSFKNGCNLIDSTGVVRFDCIDLSTVAVEGNPPEHNNFFVKALLQYIYQKTGRL